MSLPPTPLSPLEPGQRTVMHVRALLPALILAAGGLVLGIIIQDELGRPGWPVMLLGAAIAGWALFLAPRRRWAAWGWALDSDEIHVAHGVWTQVHTVVPLARIQHIDIAQGPVERACGVARLVLHTAGTSYATVTLPGISRPRAEALRDTIRTHIRAEPW